MVFILTFTSIIFVKNDSLFISYIIHGCLNENVQHIRCEKQYITGVLEFKKSAILFFLAQYESLTKINDYTHLYVAFKACCGLVV